MVQTMAAKYKQPGRHMGLPLHDGNDMVLFAFNQVNHLILSIMVRAHAGLRERWQRKSFYCFDDIARIKKIAADSATRGFARGTPLWPVPRGLKFACVVLLPYGSTLRAFDATNIRAG